MKPAVNLSLPLAALETEISGFGSLHVKTGCPQEVVEK